MSVVACIGELNVIAALIRNDTANSDGANWHDEGRATIPINRLTHHLLRLRTLSAPLTAPEIIAESLRLGALIFIIHIKRKSKSYPSNAEERISTLLKLLAIETDANCTTIWADDSSRLVRSWLLVLCSISEPDSQHVAISMNMLANGLAKTEPALSTERMSEVRQMPWLESFEPSLAALEQRLLNQDLRL